MMRLVQYLVHSERLVENGQSLLEEDGPLEGSCMRSCLGTSQLPAQFIFDRALVNEMD